MKCSARNQFEGKVAAIPAADWDACAGGDNPFVSHAFLAALEDSGSAVPERGWLPQHAALRDAELKPARRRPAKVHGAHAATLAAKGG